MTEIEPGATENAEVINGAIQRSERRVGEIRGDGVIELALATKAGGVDVGEVVSDDVERFKARDESSEGCIVAAVDTYFPCVPRRMDARSRPNRLWVPRRGFQDGYEASRERLEMQRRIWSLRRSFLPSFGWVMRQIVPVTLAARERNTSQSEMSMVTQTGWPS